MMRTKGLDKSAILLGLIIFVILLTSVFLYLQVRSDKVTDAIQQKTPIAVLFVVHSEDRILLSEVFVYHPLTYGGAILDIPGDLGLIIESLNKYDRVDVLYKSSNLKAYREKLEAFSGIQIPFYIDMDLENAEKVTDLLEGLELFIPNPVEMLNGDRTVLLPPGSVLLDGRKVKSYLTYADPADTRADGVGRRQKFIQSLIRTVGQKTEYLLNEKVYGFLKNNVSTNMDGRAFRSFVAELFRFDAEGVLFHQVLGTERDVDEKRLLFPHFDGELFRSRVKQIVETLGDADKSDDFDAVVTLQILNGTQTNGFASRTEKLFQSFGYDEAIVGNADRNDYSQTVVIDRRGNVANAQKVADIIKCKNVQSMQDYSLDGRIDVTIILGKDFDGRYCK